MNKEAPVGLRRLDQCVREEALAAVYRRARRLAMLHTRLAAVLPAETRAHFLGISEQPRYCILFADSAAWATRLRYQAPALEKAAFDALGVRPVLRFRVLAPNAVSPLPASRMRSPWLPESVVETLEASARTVDDEELAAALRRLARGAAAD